MHDKADKLLTDRDWLDNHFQSSSAKLDNYGGVSYFFRLKPDKNIVVMREAYVDSVTTTKNATEIMTIERLPENLDLLMVNGQIYVGKKQTVQRMKTLIVNARIHLEKLKKDLAELGDFDLAWLMNNIISRRKSPLAAI